LQKQHELKQEEKRLKEKEKLENVERLKRMDAFKVKQKMEKIKEEEQRMEEQRQNREKLMLEGAKMRNRLLQQRAKIKELIEKMRITKTIDINEINNVLGQDASYVIAKLKTFSHERSTSPQLNRYSTNRNISPSAGSIGSDRNSSPSNTMRKAIREENSGKSSPRTNIISVKARPNSNSPTAAFSRNNKSPISKVSGTISPRTNNNGNNGRITPASPNRERKKIRTPNRSRTPISNSIFHLDPLDKYIDDEDTSVYVYRQRQNDELLAILRQEREKEFQREQILANLSSPQERQMMIEKFNSERMAAT
jgi:hypothetical protein